MLAPDIDANTTLGQAERLAAALTHLERALGNDLGRAVASSLEPFLVRALAFPNVLRGHQIELERMGVDILLGALFASRQHDHRQAPPSVRTNFQGHARSGQIGRASWRERVYDERLAHSREEGTRHTRHRV